MQRCILSQEGRIFVHEVFVRMYSPLALEVYNRLISLGFMVVDGIKKHLLGLTESNILTLGISSHLTLEV